MSAVTKQDINQVFISRLHKIEQLMENFSIKSYRELAAAAGVDPSNISLAFSGKGSISEKTARAIEAAYDLPLLSLDLEHDNKVNTPVYTLDNIYRENIKPLYMVENFNTPDDSFYIQITANLGSIIHAGSLLLFSPTSSIKNLKINDLCLIYHTKTDTYHILKYQITVFSSDDSKYYVNDIQVIAKCLRIEM